MPETLFKPGENCCAAAQAHRISFVVDADGYFRLFRRACEKAERSILILGWDFDSRTVLEQEEGKPPVILGDFLNALAKRNRRLHVKILDWDYPIVYGMDRELPPTLGLSWKTHRRVDFRYDDTHPVAGSHHQKVVIIDDKLAFVGGLDLTNKRWDTCDHHADDPRRVHEEKPYPPFHDVMMAVDGPIVSIRRFPAERLKAEDLVTLRALTRPMLDFLSHCVRARLNCLISGGTGSGKTTLLNVLSSFISEKERIVTIEDAAELQLRQEHVVRLETRPPNVEGKGTVRQRQLVINALRMRPDRIVIGEVRGEEALDMLQAMNTGHDGSLTTVHANTPRDALGRIETMIAMGAVNLPEKAMRQQMSSAIQIVVQQTRLSDGTRKITSVSEITGMEGDVITMQEIFVFEKMGVTQDGKVIGRFRATGVRPKACERLKASGIHLPADMFEGVTEVR